MLLFGLPAMINNLPERSFALRGLLDFWLRHRPALLKRLGRLRLSVMSSWFCSALFILRTPSHPSFVKCERCMLVCLQYSSRPICFVEDAARLKAVMIFLLIPFGKV